MPPDKAEFRPFVKRPPVPPEAEKRAPGHASITQEGAGQVDAFAGDVFATRAPAIDRIDYAIAYRFAEGNAGGDIMDVYGYDNGSASFLAADVEGRGPEAASRAALIKYSLRAYASSGMTVEKCMMDLDRVYIEHCAFEETPSFASVFFGQVDAERRAFAYCSAGHDVALMARPDEQPVCLPVTSPVVGVFEDQWHLFPMRYLELIPGTVLLIGTDGITESQDRNGTFFGLERFLQLLDESGGDEVRSLVDNALHQVVSFSDGRTRDDIAVAAIRFL